MITTKDDRLIRQIQLHPSLYCLMTTNRQASIIINVIADAIEYEGLSTTTVNWLRIQAKTTFNNTINQEDYDCG